MRCNRQYPATHRLRLCLLATLVPCFLLAQGRGYNGTEPIAERAAEQRAQNPSVDFQTLSDQATVAREAGNLVDAVELYRNSVKLKPDWVEGWWYLATLLYDLNFYEEGRNAFRRFVALDPEAGAGWALLGLCEYQVKEYDHALESLERGLALGLGPRRQLNYVTRYHISLLLNRFERYEEAFAILVKLALNNSENPRIVEALGMNVLRLPYLPTELPSDYREPVLLAGRAGTYVATNRFDDAQREYGELLSRYPELPNVHYAVGIFFLQADPDAALREFQRELEVSPAHMPARLQIVFEYLKRGDPSSALPVAREAVSMDPQLFAARYVLGRTLLETGATEQAIEELETSARLAPSSPQVQFSLARAYTKAGRMDDAKRARAEFQRLKELQEENKSAAPGKSVQDPEG